MFLIYSWSPFLQFFRSGKRQKFAKIEKTTCTNSSFIVFLIFARICLGTYNSRLRAKNFIRDDSKINTISLLLYTCNRFEMIGSKNECRNSIQNIRMSGPHSFASIVSEIRVYVKILGYSETSGICPLELFVASTLSKSRNSSAKVKFTYR